MTQVEGKSVVIDRSAEDVWSFMIDICEHAEVGGQPR